MSAIICTQLLFPRCGSPTAPPHCSPQLRLPSHRCSPPPSPQVGLPFLRGAAIPLPERFELGSLQVDDSAIVAQGTLTVPPLDYDDLASQISEFLNAAAQQTPQTITVPARESGPPPPPPPAALPRRV